MAKRNVVVELSANVSGYVAGMKSAYAETYKLDDSVDKLQRRKEALRTLGVVGLGIGTAVAAGTALAVKSFADFDAAMSSVQAATHESAENMGLLRDAALEAGERTVYSATEAAAGIEELSKAGVSTADILNGGLNGALDLAAAGEISVGEAAETAASAMTQFGLAGDDVTHIADLLAAGAGKAQGGVSDLSGALNQSGLVASQMGLSIEETVGTLAEFASAGLIGSDAGTSFRSMLLRLANPTKEAAGQMEELGLNFYDAQGEFVGMEEVAAQLQERLGGLTQEERNAALANIFGQDAIRSASILYEGGAESVEKWTNAVNDAGYAQETAATRLDNLKGDWEGLTGSLETLFITMGEGANGPLRGLVQGLNGMVDGLGALPGWLQQTAGGMTLLMGAVAGIGGASVLAAPQLVEFWQSLDSLGAAGRGTKRALSGVGAFLTGPWGVAIGGAIAILGIFASKHLEAQARAQEYAATLDKTTGSITESTRQMVANELTASRGFMGWSKSIADMAELAEVDLGTVSQAILGSADAYAELEAAADRMTKSEGTDRNWAVSLKDAVDEQIGSFERSKDINEQVGESLEGTAGAAGDAASEIDGATGATDEMSESFESAEESAAEAQEAVEELADAIRNYTTDARDVREAQDNINQAINDSVDALATFVEAGGSGEEAMSGTTSAGIALRDTFDDIDATARDSAVAIRENGGTVDDAMEAYVSGRERIVEMLTELGVAPKKAKQWAREMYDPTSDVRDQLKGVTAAAHEIPKKKKTDVEANTATAMRRLDDTAYRVSHLPDGSVTITANAAPAYGTLDRFIYDANMRAATVMINALDTSSWGHENGAMVEHFAAGGFRGPDIYAGGEDIVHFAEPETGWEAYISGKPSQRDRNVGVWMQAGDRLGALDGLAKALGGSGQVAPLIGGDVNISSQKVDGALDKLAWTLRTRDRGSRYA